MNPNIVFISKAIGVLLAFGTWASLVWHGNTPADGFVAGLVSLIGFLTGHSVGQSLSKDGTEIKPEIKPVAEEIKP